MGSDELGGCAMLFFDGGIGLLFLGLWIFCIIDVITTPDGACRNLPKLAWLFMVIILPDVGSIAWLIAGHNWAGAAQNASVRQRTSTARFPEYQRPGRSVPTNPDDDEEFLSSLRARAEEQRRRAREAQQPTEDKPETDA
jgi:hypothetical protein